MRIAIVQRFLTDYRIPVFSKLQKSENFAITLYSSDTKFIKNNKFKVSSYNGSFSWNKLFPFHLSIALRNADFTIVYFPFLFFKLVKEKPNVIITEGESNLPNNLQILLFSKLFRVPYLWRGCGSIKKSLLNKLFRPLTWIGIKNASAIIAYNDYASDYYCSTFKLKKQSIFIAYNSIDTDLVTQDISHFTPIVKEKKMEMGIENKKVLLYVGDLNSRKKVHNAIISYRNIKLKHSNIAFVIVGDGNDADNLKGIVNEMNISDVYFVGRKVNDVTLYFLLGDVFVSPGLGGLSIKHAMAHGLPCVIAKDSGGSEEYVIQDGYNGFVVNRDDIAQLQERIMQLLTDNNLRETMCSNVRFTIANKYNINTMINSINNAIKYGTSTEEKNG